MAKQLGMNQVRLLDGKTATLDLTKITLKEYRGLLDAKSPAEDDDKVMARVVGMTMQEYVNLSVPEWRSIMAKFIELSREPLADPNSASASTSD